MLEAELDRSKIVEERRLRRKEKRQIKKLEKGKVTEVEQSGNVKTVSQEFFNKCNEQVNENFKTDSIEISLSELLSKNDKKEEKNNDEIVTKYRGNILDVNKPVRFIGKHREVSKKKRTSRIKQEKKDLNLTDNISSIKYLDYSDNTKSKQLDECTETFIQEIVVLQEKLFKRDPFKGDIKRKYFVGFHELKKYLIINKVKLFVLAADIKVTKENDVLNGVIEEIKNLAKNNNVPYVVALKRRKLGQLTLKFLPISCIGILNYDGANESYKKLIEEISLHKQLFQDNIEEIDFIDHLNTTILEKLKM